MVSAGLGFRVWALRAHLAVNTSNRVTGACMYAYIHTCTHDAVVSSTQNKQVKESSSRERRRAKQCTAKDSLDPTPIESNMDCIQ